MIEPPNNSCVTINIEAKTTVDDTILAHLPKVLDHGRVPLVTVLVLRVFLQSQKVKLWVAADQQFELGRPEQSQRLAAYDLVETPAEDNKRQIFFLDRKFKVGKK